MVPRTQFNEMMKLEEKKRAKKWFPLFQPAFIRIDAIIAPFAIQLVKRTFTYY